MGQTFDNNPFGKRDKNATNDVNAQGDIVATGTPGAKTVADSSQGLSDDQIRNRKLLKIGGTLLSDVSDPNSQQGGQPTSINIQRKKVPFYGDYLGGQ